MPFRVLVLTPDPNLGDLLRRVLVDAGSCQVVLAQNSHQAKRLARQVVFDLAILDDSTSDESLPELARCLREYQPRLNVVSIAPQAGLLSNGLHVLPDDLQAVLRSVDAAVKGSAPIRKPASRPTPAVPAVEIPKNEGDAGWMLDPGVTEQHLRNINLPGLVYAAVVVRRESLWAYRGSLPRSLASELARLLALSWSREQDPNGGASRAAGDMLRFVQLGAEQEFMLYARGLRFGLVMGLAFPPTTPFNTARNLMEQVLRSFLSSSGPNSQPDAAAANNSSPTAKNTTGAAGSDIEEQEMELPSLSSLLGDVPDPTPDTMRQRVPEAAPVAWIWDIGADDFPEQAQEWLTPGEGKAASQNDHPAFTFVMAPRRSQHSLSGEIATQLFQWLSELAYKRGWRLEGVSVRPDYLKFTVILPDGEERDSVLQAVRQYTSQNIFAVYPDWAEEHQRMDFWAADWLAATSKQPVSAQHLRQYLLRVGRRLSDPPRAAIQQVMPR